MHEHGCLHALRYCAQCDAVYCVLCFKEWKTPVPAVLWTNPYTTTAGTATNEWPGPVTVTFTQCNHG